MTIQEVRFFEIVNCLPTDHKERLLLAYNIAKHAHEGQLRKLTQEPFLVHPLEVGINLYNKFRDIPLFISGVLHDVAEDSEEYYPIGYIYEVFGYEVGLIVDAVTKKTSCYYNNPNLCFDDKCEKLIWGGLQNVKVLLLKIEDRESNLRSLLGLKNSKQIRMAFETQAIFQPLKKILNYDYIIDIVSAHQNLMRFLEESNLETPKDIKEFLINESFDDVSSEMFGLIYKDTSSVMWEIADRMTFDKLCSTPALNKSITFNSITSVGDKFCATFMFNSGAVISGKDIRFGISTFLKTQI